MAIKMHEEVLIEVNPKVEDPLRFKCKIDYGFEDLFDCDYQKPNLFPLATSISTT